jgi:hypothetical protein
LIEQARAKGVVLRILGGFAIYIHLDHNFQCRHLQLSLDRLGTNQSPFTDLDLVAYSSQWKEVTRILEKDLGFKPNRMINAVYGANRLVYNEPRNLYQVDVFFDKLEFSHTIVFGKKGEGRLELDFPTLSLADLLLEKLQIHQINRKDLIDILVLLLGHDVGPAQSTQIINGSYVASALSEDWGFWYDATNNLKLTQEFASQLVNEKKLSEESVKILDSRINKLRFFIDTRHKSKNWYKRSKDGTKKKWYKEVSELSV